MLSQKNSTFGGSETRKRKSSKSDDEYDDEDEDEGDENSLLDFRKDAGTIGLRVVTWNLEGREDCPKLQDLMPLSFLGEKSIKCFCLQEVKCLEALREWLWTSMGGKSEFELFEHWMGRSTPGSAGLTVLLVFAPTQLVRTGQFRLARFQHVVKREILNGQRFKFGLGSTSSRGAVSIPFNFLDTTFSLCSLRLTDPGQEVELDVQQKDLDKILSQLCNLESGAWRRGDSLHHVFAAGTFVSSLPAAPVPVAGAGSSSSDTPKTASRSLSIRKSLFRGNSNATTSKTGVSSNAMLSPNNRLATMECRERFPALDDFLELDSDNLAFDSDHVFYRSATAALTDTCLKPLQSQVVKIRGVNRSAVVTLFTLSGYGQELLPLYNRVTGNIPLHLSTRSNFHNVNTRKQRQVQQPKLSNGSEMRLARSTSSATGSKRFVPQCARCMLDIPDSDAQVPVTSEGSAFHAQCFTCDDCGKGLLLPSSSSSHVGEAPFHEVDGKLYCPDSYQKLFVNNCHECNGALGEEFLVLPDGKRFHVSCYKCQTCSRPFATKQVDQDTVIEAAIPYGNGYLCEVDFNTLMRKSQCRTCCKNFEHVVKVNGQDDYCLDCYWDKYSAKCFMCKLDIDDGEEVLEYGGNGDGNKPWCCHTSCLQCLVCQRGIDDFEGGEFVEYESNTYCKRDWDQLELESSCQLCERRFRPGDETTHTQGKAYHTKCFHCLYCHAPLTGYGPVCTSSVGNRVAFWCKEDFAKYGGGSHCARCDLALEQASSLCTSLGLRFHARGGCFTCSSCGAELPPHAPHKPSSLERGQLQCTACARTSKNKI